MECLFSWSYNMRLFLSKKGSCGEDMCLAVGMQPSILETLFFFFFFRSDEKCQASHREAPQTTAGWSRGQSVVWYTSLSSPTRWLSFRPLWSFLPATPHQGATKNTHDISFPSFFFFSFLRHLFFLSRLYQCHKDSLGKTFRAFPPLYKRGVTE